MRPVTVTTVDASGAAKRSTLVPLDIYVSPFNVTLDAIVSGTVNYDIQYTNDDIWASGYNPATGNWVTVTDMNDITAAAVKALVSPVRAVSILQNSGSGGVTLRVVQAGIA